MIQLPLKSVHELVFLAPDISMVVFSLVVSVIRASDISTVPVVTDNFDQSGL